MNNLEHTHFYFHDYETFGIHPAYDRPAQFAGVRTDNDFNVVGKPLVAYCKPPRDYLPDPEAVLVTGITPQEAMTKGYNEAEFASLIHNEFSQPGQCIVGYNNMRFDDEVTRHLFYRNFYSPYDYSWQNGNSRWDLLDVVRTYYSLRPEGINWPTNEAGEPSFRLEHITAANELNHSNAHDALSDVYGTLEVAKMLKLAQPKLFAYLLQLRHKSRVRAQFDILNCVPLVHVSGMIGSHQGNTTWIVPLAWHPEQSNSIIVCDLMGAIESLIECDSEVLRHRLYTSNKDLLEGEARVPLKLIHTNKCPIVLPAKTLTPQNAERLNIDRNRCLVNLKVVKQHHKTIVEKVMELFSDHGGRTGSNHDVEAQLYDQFLNRSDTEICATVRNTHPSILTNLNPTFQDPRLPLLYFRYKARNFPEALTLAEQLQWNDHCQIKLNESALCDYIFKIEQLAEKYNHDPKKKGLLKALYEYSNAVITW